MSTEQHATIDLVAHDAKNDCALLAMTETRSWSEGSAKLLFDIQEKLNTYIGYVAEGRLARDYPQLAQKKVEFRLMCAERPPDEVISTLRAWKEEALTPRAISWSVSVLPHQ